MEGKSMEGKETAPRMIRMVSGGDSQKKSLHAASSVSSMENARNLRFSHDLQRVPIERHRQSLNLVRVPYDDRRLSRDVTMSVPYDEIKKTVNDAIYGNDVTVFIRNTCPFCTEMLRTLDQYGVAYAVFDVDRSGNGAAVLAELRSSFGFGTVPHLFVERRSWGGCTDLKSLEHAGSLLAQLGPFMEKHPPHEARVSSLSLFWFPPVVDRYVARLSGVFTMVYSLLCVAFWDRAATPYCVLALALDFLLRLLYGSSHSVLGMVAATVLARVEPSFTAGPPKQFAAFCGIFFSVFAAGLYLGGHPAGGAVVMALLMCAAGLEGVFDFCLGCWMFGKAIKFGVVSRDIYRPYLSLADDKKWAYMFNNAHRRFPAAKREHVLLPWQEQPTPADLIRKNRLETEFKNVDVGVVRHTRIDFFAVPMTVAALAYVFKLTDGSDDAARFNTGIAYQTLAILAVMLFGIIFLLYTARALQYPKKVWKEWQHPISGNFFASISITFVLLGLLSYAESENLGITLVWIGAIAQMVMVVLRLVGLVQDYFTEEMLNASLMMVPVGSFIAAIGFATFENVYEGSDRNGKIQYPQLARLWFGIAALFTPVLFTITFKKAMHDHHADNRLRPMLWIWLATFSVAGPALLAVSGNDLTVGKDVLFQSLWCISLFLFVVCGIGFMRNFFSYVQDVSIWVMAFSLVSFALSTVQYYIVIQDQLFKALSIIAIAIACTVCAICGAYTLIWLVTLRLFKPRPKWGPLSFMKLTHECFRFAIPKYTATIQELQPSNTFALTKLVKDLEVLFLAFMEHSRHEDEVLFPLLRRFFPDLNLEADEEHEECHGAVEAMMNALAEFKSATQGAAGGDEEEGGGGDAESNVDKNALAKAGAALLESLQGLFPKWEMHVMPHLRNEEVTFTTAARKYVSLDEQVKLTEKMFDITGSQEWRLIMPFVVNNLPSDVWKARYVKTFVWACPDRAEEIGLMLYHGVDSVTWLSICQEVPMIAPRGAPGHKRIY